MSRESSFLPDAPRQFATTQWSLVLAAGRKSTSDAAAALQTLCLAYWFPLYAFVRREGHRPEEARDLTQSFFVSLLERDDLRSVSPERGRFRSFLLASMEHFLINEWHKARAQKRGGGRQPLSLNFEAAESRLQLEAVDRQTPQCVFEREWALTLLERVRAQLEAEYSTGQRAEEFTQLLRYLTPKAAAPKYAETAETLQMSEAAVKQAVYRLRRRFGEVLRAEIAQTVSTPEEIDDEIRALMSALQQTG